MSAFPRRVRTTGYYTWPPGASVPTYVRAGTLIDVPPGSALEASLAALGLEDVSGARGSGDDLDKAWLSN